MRKVITSFLAVVFLFLGSMSESAAAESNVLQDILPDSVTLMEESVELGEAQKVQVESNLLFDAEQFFLEYHHMNTGICFSQTGELLENRAEFSVFFEGDALTGTYCLDAVSFVKDGISYEISLENLQNGRFEVCGEMTSEETTAEGDDRAGAYTETEIIRTEAEDSSRSSTKKNLVIFLDPGHDNTHAGANKNGLKEEKLNLKIARYCKAELEKYYGVEVVLSRPEDGTCPYPGRTAARCNEKRVEHADSIGADIFVSLHNNSSTSASPKGATVYYPNKNYRSDLSSIGKGLAQKIQDGLVALGLRDNGIAVKFSADYTYSDGSTADYYAIIRNAKKEGIPAIIVEHAFMSNSSDASKFLSSDSKLKALGVADATAIAKYYGLSKEAPKPTAAPTPKPTAAPTPRPTVEIDSTIYPIVTKEPYKKPADGQVFLDVYEDWYTEYVKYVYEHEIMSGIGVTLKFEPQGEMTKAQVAQVLYNMEGMPKITDRTAYDVLTDVYEDWYMDAVCWAYNTGVITGDLNTRRFLPNAPVKREEIAVMMYRYAVYKQYPTDQSSDFAGLIHAEQISNWAMDGMQWAVGTGVIGGVEIRDAAGNVVKYDLKPQGTATRAQAAAILTRFCRAYD